MDGSPFYGFVEQVDAVPLKSDEENKADPVLPDAYTTYASEPIHEEFLGFGKYATKHRYHPHHYHFLNHGSPTAEDWEIEEEKSEAAYTIHSFSSLALLSLSEGGYRSIPRLRQEMINTLAGLRDVHETKIDYESWVRSSNFREKPTLVPSIGKRIPYNVCGEMSEEQAGAFQKEAKKNLGGTISLSLVPPEGKKTTRARKHGRGALAELAQPEVTRSSVVLTEEQQRERYQIDEEAGMGQAAMATREVAATTGEAANDAEFSTEEQPYSTPIRRSQRLAWRRMASD